MTLAYRGGSKEEEIRNLAAQTINYRDRWPHWERSLSLGQLPGRRSTKDGQKKASPLEKLRLAPSSSTATRSLPQTLRHCARGIFSERFLRYIATYGYRALGPEKYMLAATGRHTAEYKEGLAALDGLMFWP